MWSWFLPKNNTKYLTIETVFKYPYETSERVKQYHLKVIVLLESIKILLYAKENLHTIRLYNILQITIIKSKICYKDWYSEGYYQKYLFFSWILKFPNFDVHKGYVGILNVLYHEDTS